MYNSIWFSMSLLGPYAKHWSPKETPKTASTRPCGKVRRDALGKPWSTAAGSAQSHGARSNTGEMLCLTSKMVPKHGIPFLWEWSGFDDLTSSEHCRSDSMSLLILGYKKTSASIWCIKTTGLGEAGGEKTRFRFLDWIPGWIWYHLLRWRLDF